MIFKIPRLKINFAGVVILARLIEVIKLAKERFPNPSIFVISSYKNDITKVLEAKAEDLTGIEGVGEVIANTFVSFFEKENNKKTALDVVH